MNEINFEAIKLMLFIALYGIFMCAVFVFVAGCTPSQWCYTLHGTIYHVFEQYVEILKFLISRL